MTRLAMVAVLALLVSAAFAQVEPCYCVKRVSYDAGIGRWIDAECTAQCAPGEGNCVEDDETIGGTLWIWCECSISGDRTCYCKGKIRNPDYNPAMQPPFIECQTIVSCAPLACSPYHLLPPSAFLQPICQCNF